MGRQALLQIAQEYKEAMNSAEAKKPAAQLFAIDDKYGNIGTAAYYPDTDILRIGIKNEEIKIPGSAIHSMRLMLEKLDG